MLDTAKLITWSALGACMLYVLSIPALFGLRKKHPNLNRPFRTPFFPQMPAIAFLLSLFCLIAMIIGNLHEPGALTPLIANCTIVWEFAAFWAIALIIYAIFEKRINHPFPSGIKNQE